MKLQHRHIEKIVAHINSHLQHDLSSATLASQFQMSESTLRRQFKIHCGMPLHRYVHKQRMDTAMNLLKTGSQSIRDVGIAVGYFEPSNFTHAFLRYFKMLPKHAADSPDPGSQNEHSEQ